MSNVYNMGLANDMRTSFHEHNIPNIVRYNGDFAFGASPGDVPLFMDGQQDHDLFLPLNSHILMFLQFSAIRTDINDSNVAFIRQLGYARLNNGAMNQITLTGGQNISVAPNSEVLSVETDATSGALRFVFSGAANGIYKVAMSVWLNMISQQTRYPTIYNGQG